MDQLPNIPDWIGAFVGSHIEADGCFHILVARKRNRDPHLPIVLKDALAGLPMYFRNHTSKFGNYTVGAIMPSKLTCSDIMSFRLSLFTVHLSFYSRRDPIGFDASLPFTGVGFHVCVLLLISGLPTRQAQVPPFTACLQCLLNKCCLDGANLKPTLRALLVSTCKPCLHACRILSTMPYCAGVCCFSVASGNQKEHRMVRFLFFGEQYPDGFVSQGKPTTSCGFR